MILSRNQEPSSLWCLIFRPLCHIGLANYLSLLSAEALEDGFSVEPSAPLAGDVSMS